MTPQFVVLYSPEKPRVLEKRFFKKKFFRFICADKIFKALWGNIFKINGSQDILNVRNFPAAKIVSDNKIIDKTQTAKDQEYSAHCFGDNY